MELVNMLRTHSEDQLKTTETAHKIEEMFKQASLSNDNQGANHVEFNSYPSATFTFMKDVLYKWLFLPELQGFVFDKGDTGISGSPLRFWGFFRKRKDGEVGVEAD